MDLLQGAVNLYGVTIQEALQLGFQHQQAGRLREAEALSRQVLAVQPENAQAVHLLGVIAHQSARNDLALPLLRRAAILEPGNPEFQANLGAICGRLGAWEEAAAAYRRALAIRPDLTELNNPLGAAYAELGRMEEAVAAFEAAVRANPSSAESRYHLGRALTQIGRHAAAIPALRAALLLDPGHAAAENHLGHALRASGDVVGAIAAFRRAVGLKPDYPQAWNNLGDALGSEGALGERIAAFRRAVELDPGFAEAHCNLGTCLREAGEIEASVEPYRRALTTQPAADAGLIVRRVSHWNLALSLLSLGRYEEGWSLYEHRFEFPRPPRPLAAPRWNGERIVGKTVLIHAEQGFGDALHFLRYLPLACQRSAASVIFEVPPELARLLAQNRNHDFEVVPRHSWDGAAHPPHDFQTPLCSLPWALRALEPSPMPSPYLRADPGLRSIWRERLGQASGLRVGLAWAGSPVHPRDRFRSIAAEKFLPLLGIRGAAFYSLQVEVGGAEAPALAAAGLIDMTGHISDFADDAALIAELDLIISVDTATVHLAGALGQPVWTLLDFVPDWRWGLHGEKTFWYPTMRLFRQPASGEWDGVIERVALALSAHCACPVKREQDEE